MFQGFVELEGSFELTTLVINASGVPVNGDSLPTYRVYGPDGLLTGQTGSVTKKDSANITGATNASPIVITSAGHGLTTGTTITISGVGGNTAANGTFIVTYVDGNSFSLNSTTGSGAYTSGGTWNVTGLYTATLTCTAVNGYDAGTTYHVLVSCEIGGNDWASLETFVVT